MKSRHYKTGEFGWVLYRKNKDGRNIFHGYFEDGKHAKNTASAKNRNGKLGGWFAIEVADKQTQQNIMDKTMIEKRLRALEDDNAQLLKELEYIKKTTTGV